MVLVLKNRRFTLFLVVISGFFFLYNQVYNVHAALREAGRRDEPGDGPLHRREPVRHRLLPAPRHELLREDEAGAVDDRRLRRHRRLDGDQPVPALHRRRHPRHRSPNSSRSPRSSSSSPSASSPSASSSPRRGCTSTSAPSRRRGRKGSSSATPTSRSPSARSRAGPVGAYIFNDIMAKGATVRPDGLLELNRAAATRGLAPPDGDRVPVGRSSMWLFNRWLERQEAKGT